VRHARTQRIALEIETPKRSAAARHDIPPSTDAITRDRKSSESGLAMRAGLPASTQLESDFGRSGNPKPTQTGRITL